MEHVPVRVRRRVQYQIINTPTMEFTLYLAGPISNMPNDNREAFEAAADLLRSKGFKVINPHELHEGATDTSWKGFMQRDIPHLITADAVVTLSGWQLSKGASLEVDIATRLGIHVAYYELVSKLSLEGMKAIIKNEQSYINLQ